MPLLRKLTAGILISVAFVSCAFGYVNLNGDADAFDFGTDPTITGTGAFTISMWIRYNTQTVKRTLWHDRDTGGSGFQRAWRLLINESTTAGEIVLYIFDTSSVSINIVTASDYDDNKWHNVIAYRNAAGDCAIYVDGVLDASGSDATPVDLAAFNVAMGYDDRDNNAYWQGDIDEVALWNGWSPNAVEIALLSKSRVKGMPLQISPGNLLVYLPLDDYGDNTGLNKTAGGYKDRARNTYHATATDADNDSSNKAGLVLSYP
jgi:hypothetical protein